MATNSFSHLLPNLFIGLCKGSRLLRPYSIQFKNELGYTIFKFENKCHRPHGHSCYSTKRCEHV